MRNKNLLVKSIHNPEELNLHDVLKSGYKYAKKEKNTQGDLVSTFSSGNTITLKNPNGRQGFIKAHNIDNIKGQKIII